MSNEIRISLASGRLRFERILTLAWAEIEKGLSRPGVMLFANSLGWVGAARGAKIRNSLGARSGVRSSR